MNKRYTNIRRVRMASILLAVAIALLSLNAVAQTRIGDSSSVRKHPDYAQLTKALQTLVDEKGKSRSNTFFVSKIVETDSGSNHAWIYWPQANAIILMEPSRGHDAKYDLLWSRRFLDLKTDVVPNEAEIKGSSFLLAKDEAMKIVASCKNGDRFTVVKRQ